MTVEPVHLQKELAAFVKHLRAPVSVDRGDLRMGIEAADLLREIFERASNEVEIVQSAINAGVILDREDSKPVKINPAFTAALERLGKALSSNPPAAGEGKIITFSGALPPSPPNTPSTKGHAPRSDSPARSWRQDLALYAICFAVGGPAGAIGAFAVYWFWGV